MGLLDLVEQHHRIGLAPDGLGQPPALAIADIAGRRALQCRDGVRLLELAHIDGDDVLLAAIERLRQGQRRLGLADAGGAAEHEHADRLVRIVELGAIGLDALGDHADAMPLPYHALVQCLREVEHGFDLVLDHAADRDAGPVGDDGGDRLLVDMGVDHPARRIDRAERIEFFAEAGARRLGIGRRFGGRGIGRCFAISRNSLSGLFLAELAAQQRDLLDEGELGSPVGFERLQLRRQRCALLLDLAEALVGGVAEILVGDQGELLLLQRGDGDAGILDRRRRRGLANGDAGASRIEQTHRLVGQLASRDVARGELDGGDDGGVGDANLVVLLHRPDQAA